ncbi:Nicotinate phosphoribosyltransferase [Gryllus bimaculatus]|nr:Nicotinate phosphoribosyltransferase [Gryllus bimaculatus]
MMTEHACLRDMVMDGDFAPPLPEGRSTRARQNGVVQPLLTDLYQITMAYAYWKSGKIADNAVFDLYFRKNPFQGEFTIFAGLEECLKFLENFQYSDSDIEYLRKTLPPTIEAEFYTFLRQLTVKDVTVYAIDEGSVVFPSLMATNAARYRMAAGRHIQLLEFGLRRAQGPDGGLSASKYSYVGEPKL